ncbi:hypothetical protein [Megasphaera sp.]|uniref:hypothetical protein n=1 Tax=Megasphaera sp. TaxID=2023260 RepID=UPI0025855659|nr:hypothetical protein [uncultured Megasphaera sp.]
MTERDVYLMLGTDDEKKRPSVVCGEVNNAIYTMKVVAESYGVVFSDAVIDQLYKELDEHLKRMQKL